jgi:hypothetical protein
LNCITSLSLPQLVQQRSTVANSRHADIRRNVTVIIPAIEPKPNPATPKPGSANAMTAATLAMDAQYGLVVDQ